MSGPTTPREMFEMFQRMLNPMAFPMQSLLFPNLSVEEVDRKIAELKSVESWLMANLSILQLSIKTMEYQRTLLVGGDNPKSTDKVPNPFANPALWPWNMMTGGQNQATDKDDEGKKK
ncbi:MAG TPA: PhaM family polyhydroxyalkanoate granule multifunctional regulatory protein [Burkholderiales bacterium]|nr:PhaM family polyhydroxyalkanoate granule multifunctional regulatory protein [Burkholderiales bacterium]